MHGLLCSITRKHVRTQGIVCPKRSSLCIRCWLCRLVRLPKSKSTTVCCSVAGMSPILLFFLSRSVAKCSLYLSRLCTSAFKRHRSACHSFSSRADNFCASLVEGWFVRFRSQRNNDTCQFMNSWSMLCSCAFEGGFEVPGGSTNAVLFLEPRCNDTLMDICLKMLAPHLEFLQLRVLDFPLSGLLFHLRSCSTCEIVAEIPQVRGAVRSPRRSTEEALSIL